MAIDYFRQQFGEDEYEDSAPTVMSDEELYQLTGSWEAAAAMRDQQNNALNQYNWSQPATGGLNLANDAGAAVAVTAPPSTGALTQAATAVDNTAVTGGLPATNNTGNVLSGNILAGASWNSTNNSLVNDLTALTGLQTINTAVGGATSADTLQQLNDFTAAGGSFAPGSTVFLQTGGVDMLQGVDDATITSNINQIVSTLGAQGVNVVLTSSPRAGSLTDVVNNNFETGPASFYSDIAANNSNVVTVDTMGQILQDKSLLRDALHVNAAGEEIYNKSVMEAYERLNPNQKIEVANKVAATGGASAPEELAQAIDEVAGTNIAATAAQATTPANTVAVQLQGQTYNVSTTDVNKIKDQILAQGTTSKWTGQGFGSAEANAEAMAKNLVASGVTDINQVALIDKKVDAQVTPDGQGGFVDALGRAVDASLVKEYTDYGGESGNLTTTYSAPIGIEKVIGNKATGTELISDYDRSGGSAWSGTFAGDGNTAFRTSFDASGKPIFYTTGASSNDLVTMIGDDPILGKIATVAAGYFGGPAGVAALQAAMGKSIEDIAKSAVLAYVGGEIVKGFGSTDALTNTFGQSGVDFTNSLVDTFGQTGAKIITNAAGKFVASGGKADVSDLLLSGSVDAGTDALLANVEGFNSLTAGQKTFVSSVVKTTINNGGDLSMSDLIDAGFAAATTAVNASKTGTVSTAIQANTTINNAVNNEIERALTFDATGSTDVNAAMQAADSAGYGKFTFDGKTYTIDINNAGNTIAQLEADALATNTAANLKGGEFDGVDAAVAAQAKANNTVIGNTEADTLEEATALAKVRNPTGTTFTYGGTTYTMGTSNAAVTQALNTTQRSAVLDDIKNAKTFNEAFATARSGLGAGQTFTWQGKEYSTATAAERPDLSTPSIDALNRANLATTTNASSTVAAQNDTLARNAVNQSDAETARLARQNTTIASMEKTGLFGTIANAIQSQMKLSSEAANDYLKNNPNSPITNSVSTAYEAAGNLQKNVAGGLALGFDNKPLSDAFVKSGNDLTKVGQSIGNGVVDTKNWNDTMSLVQGAQGWEKLGVIAGRIMDGTSGLGRQVEVELRQELPGLFLGGGSVRGIMVATGVMDVGETYGDAALGAYDAAAKKGLSHADSLSQARTAGAVAGMTEAALQLTLGKLADFGAGKINSVAGKTTGKVVGEGIVEGTQEGGAALAVDLALGNQLNVNNYLTQAVAGAAVGKGTAVATSPSDIATTTTINNNITAAVTSGNAASVNTAITSSVQQSLSSGSSVELAVGASVNSAITNGADANSSITSAVSSAVESGADVTQTVTASIDSSITAGADTTTAINSTVTSAITSGANVSQTVSGSITAATSAGVSVDTAVTNTVTSAVTASIATGADVATSVNSAVTSAITSAATSNANTTTAISSSVSSSITAAASSNANVTTAVESAVTSAITTAISSNVNAASAITTAVESAVTTALNSNVNATAAITTSVTAAINAAVNANANGNTNANVNANVNAAVNAAVAAAVNAGVDANTAVNAAVNAAMNANVNPNVNANINSNINANININIDALKKSATETATSATEKVDLISTVNDLISGTPTATPTTTPKTPTKTTAKKAAGLTSGLIAGAAMAGDLDRLPPQMLKAYMTQDKFVDPLAELRALQEGMNTEKMPESPKVNTQEPDMPDQGNWKYGNAPDDLDTLFDEKEGEETAFKAGGFVSPLQMASGGAMPLLVKSGGALGALPRGDGRLDFRHGAHVAGEGDGQSDDIKAMLADGEFVFPADVVSALGNGSTKAGSDKLYEMMHSIRAKARSKKPKDLPPPALKSPLDYLKKVRSK